MDKIISVPFHLGDLIKDTYQLDATEFGAYMRLLIAHYSIGRDGIPDNDAKLARLAGCPTKTWNKIRETVRGYFRWNGEMGIHPRVLKELDRVSERSSIARANGLKRNKTDQATAQPPPSNSSSNHKPLTSNHKPIEENETTPVVSQKKVVTRANPLTTSQQHFGDSHHCPADFANDASRNHDWPQGRIDAAFGAFLDHHTAKGSRFADWRAAFRTWCRNDVKYSEQGAGRSGYRVRNDAASVVDAVVANRYGKGL